MLSTRPQVRLMRPQVLSARPQVPRSRPRMLSARPQAQRTGTQVRHPWPRGTIPRPRGTNSAAAPSTRGRPQDPNFARSSALRRRPIMCRRSVAPRPPEQRCAALHLRSGYPKPADSCTLQRTVAAEAPGLDAQVTRRELAKGTWDRVDRTPKRECTGSSPPPSSTTNRWRDEGADGHQTAMSRAANGVAP